MFSSNFMMQGDKGAHPCKRCNGIANGREEYQDGSGATGCKLCDVGGSVNQDRTACSECTVLTPSRAVHRIAMSNVAHPL